MKKIGFCIQKCHQGLSTIFQANEESSWSRKVSDIRDIMPGHYEQSEEKTALVMTFSKTGCYLIVAKRIAGRGNDYTAGWIYIPAEIVIAGADLLHIVQIVKDQLLAGAVDKEILEWTFGKEYDTAGPAEYEPSADGGSFAIVRAGAVPVSDILGKYRYQPEYSKYKFILIDDGMPDSLEITDSSAPDLTGKLTEMFVLCPPAAHSLPQGVRVYLKKPFAQLFDKPVRLYAGANVELIFKRKGFGDIGHRTTVVENNQTCDIPPLLDWKLMLMPSDFKICDSNLKEIPGALIRINGRQLEFCGMQISESDAEKAKINISANGYEPFDATADLTVPPRQYILHRAENTIEGRILLSNGKKARITLTGKNLPDGCPLEGYRKDRDGILEYIPTDKFKNQAIGFAAACVIGLLIWGCCALVPVVSGLFDKDPEAKEQTATVDDKKENATATAEPAVVSEESSETKPVDEFSEDNAIVYLDSNDKWTKSEMEKYPLLQGLFDDLNSRNVTALTGKWNDRLSKSEVFPDIVTALNNHSNQPSEKYNAPNDEVITVRTYINKLNNPVIKKATPQNDATPGPTESDEQPKNDTGGRGRNQVEG